MIDFVSFSALLANYDIVLSEHQLKQLDRYAELLVEWNEVMNLTAITDPQEIEVKHFLDCLITSKHLNGSESIIDVGTGAGFPGVVLKIACPDIKLCLLDSLDKRLNFLDNVLKEIGASAQLIHARAEDAGHFAELRESFDAATARAVAPLNILCEYCMPFVKECGRFIALKGSAADEELTAAANAIKETGGTLTVRKDYTLPDGSERTVLEIAKTSSTPERYPRRAPAIKKKPL